MRTVEQDLPSSTKTVGRSLRGFRAAFGGEPSVATRGPGRVNLIGEHTDYNEGFALPFAIDREVVATARLRPDRRLRLVTGFVPGVVEADLDRLDDLAGRGWAVYPLGVIWALGQFGVDLGEVPGVEVAFASDVPSGAGLSSSAALESAVAVALNELWGLGLSGAKLARVGQLAENRVVGAPTGILDQSASLLGRQDAAVFLDCRTLETETVPLGLAEAGLRVMVVDTRVAHDHATGGYGVRRAQCERAAAALGVAALRDVSLAELDAAASTLDPTILRRARHVVTENARVLQVRELLREKGPRAIGEALVASHASLRDDFEVTVPELDAAVAAMLDAGAVGARMTGGGFGGCAIGLVDADALDATADAVRSRFAAAGFGGPKVFDVRATVGAGVIPS